MVPGLFLFGGVGVVILFGAFGRVALLAGGRCHRAAGVIDAILLGTRRPSAGCRAGTGRIGTVGTNVLVRLLLLLEICREIQIGVLKSQHHLQFQQIINEKT